MTPKQIRYHDWHEEVLADHQSYWEDITDISFFISSALSSLRPNPFYTGTGSLGTPFPELIPSTIHVSIADQYYGACRIACIFASTEKVESSFSYNKRSFDLISEKYQILLREESSLISGDQFERSIYPDSIKFSLSEYEEVCIHFDLMHFKKIYSSALRLWPQYKVAILDGCPRPELLSSSQVELEKYFDELLLSNNSDDEILIKKRYLESTSALNFPNTRFIEV